MVRKPLIHYPGALYHLTLRGNGGMANHAHFALQVGEVVLSKIMQNLSFHYTGRVNKGRGRVGIVKDPATYR